nr:unnamed protein product [Digitaria exilis]
MGMPRIKAAGRWRHAAAPRCSGTFRYAVSRAASDEPASGDALLILAHKSSSLVAKYSERATPETGRE